MKEYLLVLVILALQVAHISAQTTTTANPCLDVGTVCASLADKCSSGLYYNGKPISQACPQTCNSCKDLFIRIEEIRHYKLMLALRFNKRYNYGSYYSDAM